MTDLAQQRKIANYTAPAVLRPALLLPPPALPPSFDELNQALDDMRLRNVYLEQRIVQLETVLHEPLTRREAPAPSWRTVSPTAGFENSYLDQRSPQHDLKNRFIADLLHGHLSTDQDILRDAAILGMDFSPPRTVILIDAAAYILHDSESLPGESADAQIRQRAQTVIRGVVSFFHLPNETICAYLGDGAVAVLKASDTKNLAAWAERGELSEQRDSAWANLPALRRAGRALQSHLSGITGVNLSIGIGRYHPGLPELARSYQDARAALSLGRRFSGQPGVYSLDNLGIAAFVGVPDEQTRVDLASHLLSPLTHEPELLDTLSAFFAEDCCPAPTAARLTIHRNTLAYRLDKITALTGLNPRRFDDGVQIRLALALRALHTPC
ncbi:MAG: helix-turn-helix domain-containing protein [Chloroflexaceae bacterium]|jgi:carbohydrate diacid regulator|nr:helix-turn-helix domain-containing protein [Chloroflexaceae bacterium]